jgi:hypothetical protein
MGTGIFLHAGLDRANQLDPAQEFWFCAQAGAAAKAAQHGLAHRVRARGAFQPPFHCGELRMMMPR